MRIINHRKVRKCLMLAKYSSNTVYRLEVRSFLAAAIFWNTATSLFWLSCTVPRVVGLTRVYCIWLESPQRKCSLVVIMPGNHIHQELCMCMGVYLSLNVRVNCSALEKREILHLMNISLLTGLHREKIDRGGENQHFRKMGGQGDYSCALTHGHLGGSGGMPPPGNVCV